MKRPLRSILLTVALLAPAAAIAQDNHEQHHPAGAASAPAPAPKPADKPAMGGMGMMDKQGMMSGDMMQMMSMMRDMMGAQNGMMGGGMMMGSRQAMCAMANSHIDGRLAYLKAELKITEAQEPLWKAYEDAARVNANVLAGHCDQMAKQHGASAVTLTERLDAHEQLLNAQLEVVRATNKALKPLYAALSDSQKQTADGLFWGPMGMM